MSETKYRWRVTHPEHGTTEVLAVDRLRALTAAAMQWQQRWTLIARDCDIVKLESRHDR